MRENANDTNNYISEKKKENLKAVSTCCYEDCKNYKTIFSKYLPFAELRWRKEKSKSEFKYLFHYYLHSYRNCIFPTPPKLLLFRHH